MKSDVIKIQSDLTGRDEAMQAAENFISYNGFEGKNAMHIRLLTEELVSMVHGIMDKFAGDLWFESEKTDEGVRCNICLSANKSVDPAQEEQMLSVASSGKNENAKGILGKIRESFRVSAQHSADGVYLEQYSALNSWYGMGAHRNELPGTNASEAYWSLMRYRINLEANKAAAADEWDELEKSIIAKLADDVKVWLKSNTTEVVIEKLVK
ncbi:MAG: hypothetical protein IJ740_19070 [Ruminococcus sp.]|nr:hypothetical protein [Ruminococcus sp.]MBR1752945.1 hypothetical protein [Ruminococcus sp.]